MAENMPTDVRMERINYFAAIVSHMKSAASKSLDRIRNKLRTVARPLTTSHPLILHLKASFCAL